MLALFLLGGGAMIILSTRPATGAMGFLIALLSIGGLFAMLHQSFLFFAQLLVAVGAVVVVTLIMILTINLKDDQLPEEKNKHWWLLGTAIAVSPFAYLLYRSLIAYSSDFPAVAEDFGGTRMIGEALFGGWVLPFEILSILLLAAMVGAIIIGKKEQSYDRES
jgi:NADH-quinone oxidoreductase subunit J